ncbi:MAG: hypothetical protein RDV41_14755, partial [Planctomycetota bacterium]|nr:hypothetical protein [Planctomycetota bacterium]
YGAAGGQTGEVRFRELAANGSEYVGFKAVDNITGSLIWQLPATDGTANQTLVTNGSGVLSWANNGAGSAPAGASFVTLALNPTLTSERVLTSGTGIGVSDGGANGNVTVYLGSLTADWLQNGAFNICLNNADSSLRILESVGGSWYGSFDVADLTGHRWYTLPDASGNVLLDSTVGSTAFVQNGNAFALPTVLGTNDSYPLVFETNNIECMRISNTTGHVGVGTNAPASRLHAMIDDTFPAAITNMLSLEHLTTGAAANGIGAGIRFASEDGVGNPEDIGLIAGVFEVATNGSESSGFVFHTRSGGAAPVEKMRLTAQGDLVIAGGGLQSLLNGTFVVKGNANVDIHLDDDQGSFPDAAVFSVLNGSNVAVLTLSESGAMTVTGEFTAATSDGIDAVIIDNNSTASDTINISSSDLLTTTDAINIGSGNDSIALGGGAPFKRILSASSALDFSSTGIQSSTDLTIGVTGAAIGDTVALGVPNAAVIANSCFTAWVSAADTVTVRFNNYSIAPLDPSSATFRVTVIKY